MWVIVLLRSIIYVKDRNSVNFLIYLKPLNYIKKVLKYSAPQKFGRPCMRFILIIYGIPRQGASSAWLFHTILCAPAIFAITCGQMQ